MKKQIISSSCILIIAAIFSQKIAADTFDGRSITVTWEEWDSGTPIQGGTVLGVSDKATVVASNQAMPDITEFHNKNNDYQLWDIDFNNQTIDLTYTSIYNEGGADWFEFQYMYTSRWVGFHFEDTENNLTDIVNVTVSKEFTPFLFNPELVTFDANNIYVDLNGSMCHLPSSDMGSMEACGNSNSPTGFNNKIKLTVAFAGDGNSLSRLDAFFNWAEQNYSAFLPGHQETIDIEGYRARHYPGTKLYVGTKDGRLYTYGYGDVLAGMTDIGELEQWFSTAGIVAQN